MCDRQMREISRLDASTPGPPQLQQLIHLDVGVPGSVCNGGLLGSAGVVAFVIVQESAFFVLAGKTRTDRRS